VISSRRHPAEALELAMSACAGLERTMRHPDPDTLSVYGALHLAGVHAAAAVYDRAMTATLLARARAIARRIGDGNRMGTVFGHVNVAMHAISASLQLGGTRAAIETGESLSPAALPAERSVGDCLGKGMARSGRRTDDSPLPDQISSGGSMRQAFRSFR
jgi:hypothetical protein